MSNPPTDTPDTLTRYREKRDFSRTPEPAGKTREQGRELSFVVQRHAARRLHYDLRLEWHGVMKSWAVTRGPSMDPADKRLAVEVEDHPLDYASFEGTIPKPSYGGGIVQVWDRGTWSPVNPAAVDADLAKGELKFIVSGERLNGGFLLVRMRPRRSESDTHRNWLLIKERDSAATPGAGDAVLRAETSVLSGRTLDEIGGADDPDAAPEKTRASAKAPPRKSHKATPATKSAITHPDKVIWPATPDTPAVTKADLAAYYALYADLILPQVGGRPLSILRAPDGIDGQLFFQRHAMRGQSSSIGSVTIEGQAKPYLRIDDAAALAALAQIAVVELHPWGARADHPDVPDRLVFDFDPAAGLAFENVIDAALELRQRLKTLGLEFVRAGHRRQRFACRRAIERAETNRVSRLAGSETIRSPRVRDDGTGSTAALHHEDGETGAGRQNLSRLPAQRSAPRPRSPVGRPEAARERRSRGRLRGRR